MLLLRHEPFDLVILDLGMPPPDGFSLLKQLRAFMSGLRILVTSGFMQSALMKAAKLLGAVAPLPKTDAPANLWNVVDNQVRKHLRPVPNR